MRFRLVIGIDLRAYVKTSVILLVKKSVQMDLI